MVMVRCYMMTDRQGWADTSKEQRMHEREKGRRMKRENSQPFKRQVFPSRTQVEQLLMAPGTAYG